MRLNRMEYAQPSDALLTEFRKGYPVLIINDNSGGLTLLQLFIIEVKVISEKRWRLWCLKKESS